LAGALDVVAALVDRGAVVSAGHSAATYEQAKAGFDAGIRAVTHIFNAMSPLDHRDPGLPGAALADPRVTVCLIPDGVHVHPALVRIVVAAVGRARLAIVTDAIAALGMPPGTYRLGGQEVVIAEANGIPSARLPDRRLAGSVLSMDDAVHNLASYIGGTEDDAARAATSVPAALLGVER